MKKLSIYPATLALLTATLFGGGDRFGGLLTPVAPIEVPLYYSSALKVGTLGVGIDFAIPMSETFSIRLNVNGASLSQTRTREEIDFDLNLDLLTAGVMVDYYPFTQNALRFSAGVYHYDNKADGTGAPTAERYNVGDSVYTREEMGSATGSLFFENIAPYIGIGYGGKSTHKGWDFTLDVGLMYHGDSNLEFNLIGGTLDAQTQADFAQDIELERKDMEDELNKFPFYPVVMVGVSYNF